MTKRRLDLEVDQDIYWELVKLGAELQMDHETYSEFLLKEHVEQLRATNKVDQQATD